MFSPIIGLGFSSGGKSRNNIEEKIQKNVEIGAKEFFTGYTPPYWYNKFGFEVSPNGRFSEPEQITSYEDLELVVKEVHKNGAKIMGNINARYYTKTCEIEIKQIITDFLNVGIDGFICGNIGIIEYLKEISEGEYDKGFIINGKEIQLNISTIMGVYNKDAISFLLEEYPVGKVILSREITLKEIEDILNSFPNLTFEVFGEGDFCRYNNATCLAEHKYTDRDICTVVVNDLVIKKAINYDFRENILSKDKTYSEKIKSFENEYKDEFEELEILLEKIHVFQENEEGDIERLRNCINKIKRKYTLYFDSLEKINSKNNKNLKIVIDALNYLLKYDCLSEKEIEYRSYLLMELKKGYKRNLESIKNNKGGVFSIRTKEKDLFYNRSDLLNLFVYSFFDKFKNIDTVKFPTRGRNYLPKLQLIEESINNPEKILEKINLDNSYKRAHYDLKYLFKNDKEWFRKIREKKLYENS